MTYEEVISLGWIDRDTKKRNKQPHYTFEFPADPGFDYHIMMVVFDYGEGFCLLMIKCVKAGTTCNEWENSDNEFYGQIKKKEELDLVMQLVGVTEYKQ